MKALLIVGIVLLVLVLLLCLPLGLLAVYEEEGWTRLCPGTVVDLSSLEGTTCYCEEASADEIRRAIAPYGPSGIHWIDSGDYHYLSLFWLEKVSEPFCLVLFDHHPDMQEPAFPMLSCGGWVRDALRLPMLRSVLLLGISPQLLPHAEGFPAVRAVCEGDELLAAPEKIAALLPEGLPLYFSIDKDVLSRNVKWMTFSCGVNDV